MTIRIRTYNPTDYEFIISLCEEAARSEGFGRVELMATLAGEPLYRACGYQPLENLLHDRGDAEVPLLRTYKSL